MGNDKEECRCVICDMVVKKSGLTPLVPFCSDGCEYYAVYRTERITLKGNEFFGWLYVTQIEDFV